MVQTRLGVLVLIVSQLACGVLAQPTPPSPTAVALVDTATPPPAATATATATATVAVETAVPTPAASPTPSPTVAEPVRDLEILEWSEFPYANLADPSNKDTRVEALIRNPNDFAVRVDTDTDELRFVNAAGDVVYANPSARFYIWEGEWLLPGETAALSACVCFQSSGLERQAWQTLQLIAPLERADDLDYTRDVEVTLGEFFNLAEAHLGGDSLGAEVSLTNTSDRVLKSIPMRVYARDAEGRYVGIATFGDVVASFTENVGIQPGATATGVLVSEIDYIPIDVPLTYEVVAIGLPQP